MFAKSNYALAIAQSLWVSLSTAFFAVLVCYPMVLAIVYVAPRSRHRLLLMLAVAPFWSSYVLRLFSWQILLAKQGHHQLRLGLGRVREPADSTCSIRRSRRASA